MKQFLLLLCLLLSSFLGFGQCPSSGSFNSQAEIDQFEIDYPNCTELEFLTIHGDDIVDLTPLSGIVSIGGLSIRNNLLLEDLAGLDNVVSIVNDMNFIGFEIRNNPALTSISALGSMANNEPIDIEIENNPLLESFVGLNSLNGVAFSFFIVNNDSVTDFSGFENFVNIDDFIIRDNDALVSFNGLTSLEIAGTFEITNNDALVTLSAFENLQTISSGFIKNNDLLTSLEGLNNLSSVFSNLQIEENVQLTDITAINNINLGTVFSLSIIDNPMLSVCNTDFICSFIESFIDNVTINDNAPGCNSIEEVESLCPDCPEGDVVLTSQAAVDAYVANFPDCPLISGVLSISGSDINDLSGLSNLTAVNGELVISNNPLLSNLEGLNNLEQVNAVSIIENEGLTSLEGLNSIQEVVNFVIINCTNIEVIDNLDALQSIELLEIVEMSNLTSLEGLSNVSFSDLTLTGNTSLNTLNGLEGSGPEVNFLFVEGNTSLIDLVGLNNLTTVTDISILGNSSLTSLNGLSPTSVSALFIGDNDSLLNLNGLESLTSGDAFNDLFININDNPLLEDISGLSNIEETVNVDFTITNNNLLSQCAIESVCNVISNNLPISISNNTPGCNTVEEVDQACRPCDSPVILTSQEEVNNFPIIYADCNVELVNGLTISGDDISDLTPLSSITTIQGGLTIVNNTILESLEGLGSLSEVDTFEIVQNNQLVNFDGLADTINTNSLIVDGNASLQDLIGFPSLDSGLTSLTINNNAQLNSLTGLEVLSILSDLTISNNESLVNLQGLQNLETIEIAFSINNNENIQNLTGLENLTSNEIVEIVVLEIFQNNSLMDISGLNNFNNNAIVSLYIYENPLLSVCSNLAVCNFLNSNIDGDIIIENNAVGCNTPEEVLDSCGFEFNKISGTIGYDFNNDGCDESDYDTGNVLVTTSNGDVTFSSITDANGYFELFVDEGTYVSEVVDASLLNGFTVTPNSITSDFVGLGNEEEIQFCIVGDGETNDVSVSLLPLQLPRPGEPANYIVQFENKGAQIMSGDITFEYDDAIMFYIGSEITPDSNEDGVLVWNYNDLLPFESRTFVTSFELLIPPDVIGGEELNSSLVIMPLDGDIVLGDNTVALKEIVVNSYDPNDKQVLQGEGIFEEQVGDYLDYLVRFQNTGTADALNVVVTDTLSDNLDWNTLRILSASHEYRVEITNENEVAFIFEDINLPPEEVDEEASNGHIAFEIRTNDDLILGDSVENIANIFFDFNPPIITNTVVTTVVEPLSVDEFLDEDIVIYPNPVSQWLTIQLGEDIPNAQMSLLSLQGQVLASSVSASIDMSRYSSGVYFLKIETDKGKVVKKVIKK